MAYEHEEGTASMFQNDYKEDGDKKPDYTGKGKVGGDLKNFALWKRQTKKGKARRKSFKARHAKNIKKGKMSAAYWANRVKW